MQSFHLLEKKVGLKINVNTLSVPPVNRRSWEVFKNHVVTAVVWLHSLQMNYKTS